MAKAGVLKSMWVDFDLTRHLAMSEDIVGCHNCGDNTGL